MTDPVLQTFELSKVYKKSHLWKSKTTIGLKDVNLSIAPGEIFGLLGQNGAGKTTALKLILGLLFPTHGSIHLFDKKMPNRQSIQKTGFVPEVPYFPKYLTVKEILQFYGTLSSVPKEEIHHKTSETLQLVKMTEHQHKKIKECSKGMLQRLSLAQSLIHNPSLLILDEPITGLDPLGLNEMRDLITQLNGQGKTILFSSHILAEVERIAHRVGILVEGKLVKVLEAKDWSHKPGALEEIYVDTVRQHGVTDSL